jgi:hypothetical protein
MRPNVLMLIMAFGFFTISASIMALNNMLARYALCPTASDAYFKEGSGGTVHKLVSAGYQRKDRYSLL